MASNASLAIEAGTVVKFNPDAHLRAEGILDVQKTADNRVVFTSYRDDSYGGDTNGDGPSSGVKGDWYHLNLQNSAITFTHSIVRYAGQGGTFGLYVSNASTPVVRDSVLEHNGTPSGGRWHGGIYVRQGSDPSIENNVIWGGSGNSVDMGISVSADSDATIRGNTIVGHYFGTFSEATDVIIDKNVITGATYAVYTNGGEVTGNDIRNSSYALYQGYRSDPVYEANAFTNITNHVIGVHGTLESEERGHCISAWGNGEVLVGAKGVWSQSIFFWRQTMAFNALPRSPASKSHGSLRFSREKDRRPRPQRRFTSQRHRGRTKADQISSAQRVRSSVRYEAPSLRRSPRSRRQR